MSFSPTQNGDYSCIVTDINGCSDTSESININNLPSLISNYHNELLVIHPNPFTTKTTIKLLESNNCLRNIILFDYLGKKIMEKSNINENHIILEKSNIKRGVYMLLIYTEKFTTKHKLVIN